MDNVQAKPMSVNVMDHEYGKESQDGYAVCSLCGHIENSGGYYKPNPRYCWAKLLEVEREKVAKLEREIEDRSAPPMGLEK